MYAVQSQLRKQLQRHKALYVDQSSTLAAMYKQAHVDFSDSETCPPSDGAPPSQGVAGSPEMPTGYDMRFDDEWGYDPEAANGYRVDINGEGESCDLKARQQTLKEKLRSRHHGESRGPPADLEAGVEVTTMEAGAEMLQRQHSAEGGEAHP